jgi:catechol 2,3-dioxygenase-like lactoylglutathione lyase family enzyme
MHLNHLDLPVPDVAATADFFVRGFGFALLFTRGDEMALLRDGEGFVLALSRGTKPAYPPDFHVGFLQPSDAAVHALHGRLRDAGIDAPAPAIAYGCLQFWLRAPGGVTIEISHRG